MGFLFCVLGVFFVGSGDWLLFAQLFFVEFSLFGLGWFFVFYVCIATASKSPIRT